MKIRYKLIVGFTGVGLSIALASYIVLHSIEKGPKDIAEFQTPKLYLIQGMSATIEEALYQSVFYMLTADNDSHDQFYRFIHKFDAMSAEFMKITSQAALKNDQEKGLFADLMSTRNDIVEKAETFFKEVVAGRGVRREALLEYANVIERLDAVTEELVGIEKEHVEIAQKAALASVISAHNAHKSVVLFSVLSSVLIGWLISRTISKPIGKLKNAAVSIAQGDLDVHIETDNKRDEIADLASAFKNMKGNLVAVMQTLRSEIVERKQAEDALKKLNEDLERRVYDRTVYLELANMGLEKSAHTLEEKEMHLRTILDNVYESIFTVDESCIITACNLATEHIFGWKTDEIVGRHISVLGLEGIFAGDEVEKCSPSNKK
ncbi:MAG: HAMP domain-containing protein, partial [Nitrospirota bacterium]